EIAMWIKTFCFALVLLISSCIIGSSAVYAVREHGGHGGRHGFHGENRGMQKNKQFNQRKHNNANIIKSTNVNVNKGNYYHNGKRYNYFHNGNYYNFYYNGDYYNYFHNGAYFLYFINGVYCNKIRNGVCFY